MKKRLLAMLLVLMMVVSFAAGCSTGTPDAGNATPAPTDAAVEPTEEPTPEPQPKDDSWFTHEGGAMTGDVFGTASKGANGAVVSGTSYASQIGLQILEQGGNAIDAAVAMIFAVGLTEPASSGVGGAGQMVVYLADEQRYTVLEYMTMAPGGTYPGMTDDSYSAFCIAIPGIVHGACTALEKYGTMSIDQVLAPVIELARNGWEVTSRYNAAVESAFSRLSEYEYSMNLYTNNGDYFIPGEVIKNEDLANVLQMIAEGGKEAFYDSEWTDMVCDYLKESYGAILTRDDFAQYTTVERDPISTTYRGKTVYTVGGPANGGAALLEMLNVMDLYDLSSYGHDSAEAIRITAEAYSLGYRDGVDWLADPDYYDLPVDTIVSKEYAAERNKLINSEKVFSSLKRSDLTATLNESGEKAFAAMDREQGGTTHLCAADQFGNMVSSTNTLGVNFGTGIAVPDTGFTWSAHLRNLDDSSTGGVNMLMPYARVRSSMCPTIIANEDGTPLLAIGSPGNWAIVNSVGIGISNILDFNMNVAQAINAPRFYREYDGRKITVEERYSDETLAALKDVKFFVNKDGDYSSSVACLAAIYKDPASGEYSANGDHRRLFQSYAY